jgi:CubicO group peptidase (beta-lactamase class C family)
MAILTNESRLAKPDGGQQGLGWKINPDMRGELYMGHAGAGPGFATELRIYPQHNLGLVLMGNDTTFDHAAILNLAAGLDW